MTIVPVMFLLQIVLISLSRVLILLKFSPLQDFEVLSRDIIEYSLMPRSSHLRLFNACKVGIWTPGFLWNP